MFIKFLVDKNIISKEQLVKALAVQMESMPSLLSVIIKEGSLDTNTLYDYVVDGHSLGKSLLEIIREKEALSQEKLSTLFKKQNISSKSLGDILIENGFLERPQYEQALRDYSMVNPEQKDEPKESKEEKEEPAKPVSSAPAISSAALESLKAVQGLDDSALAELEERANDKPDPAENESPQYPVEESSFANESNQLDSPVLMEYLEVYDEMFQSNLYVTANRYRLKGKEQDLKELHGAFIKLLSLAKLNDFSFQIKLIEPFENIMGLILNGVTDPREGWQDAPVEALEILWEFRKSISEGQEEGKFLADPKWKQKYLSNLKTVMTFLKKSA